ncbi:hypothetical protein QU522_01390 [Klebsiella pneumoniae subsp. pneumoniae]|nr:hypothetical protein [Klebsiella pneumoniae]WKA67378.1 hypothetical protein QU522_01390 [Klebsiella pneumoniae subsp. pneumoniae]
MAKPKYSPETKLAVVNHYLSGKDGGEVAYITLSSFRVNPFFRIFLCNRTGCLCEVIHIRRVDGGAL